MKYSSCSVFRFMRGTCGCVRVRMFRKRSKRRSFIFYVPQSHCFVETSTTQSICWLIKAYTRDIVCVRLQSTKWSSYLSCCLIFSVGWTILGFIVIFRDVPQFYSCIRGTRSNYNKKIKIGSLCSGYVQTEGEHIHIWFTQWEWCA